MTISTSILVLGYFANLKLAGDRAVRDTVNVVRRPQSNHHLNNNKAGTSTNYTNGQNIRSLHRTRRRRRGAGGSSSRSRRYQNHTRVSVMSDSDLEAELSARRASRLRERERYARAMRSEKLTVLEGELLRLRSEISRMDPTFNTRNPPLPSSRVSNAIPTHHGTPPNARWESLQPRSSQLHQQQQMPGTPRLGAGAGPGGPPPPPPPPPGGFGGGEDEELEKDPETKRREKEERVRRREAKRKEREAAKKPLTLAEIIRAAGPDPMNRLKPSGSTKLKDIHDPEDNDGASEDFTKVKDSLKKAESEEEEKKDDEKEGEKAAEEKQDKDTNQEDDKDDGKENGMETNDKDEEGKKELADSEGTKEEITEDAKTIDTNGDSKENGNGVPSKSEEEKESSKDDATLVSSNPESETPLTENESQSSKEEAKQTAPSPPPPPSSASGKNPSEARMKDQNPADALSALTAKLPAMKNSGKTGDSGTTKSLKPPLPSQTQQKQASPSSLKKRASIEERRRQRREVGAATNKANAEGDGSKAARRAAN